MTNHDWIELLRMIPKDKQNTLVLTTLSGMDLAIEVLLRTELSFFVFRGRVMGNTDEGRVFFLPYRQIDFLQINREVKELEIRELFGDVEPAQSAANPQSSPGGYTTITNASNSGFAPAAPAQMNNGPAPIANGPSPQTGSRYVPPAPVAPARPPVAPPPVRLPPGVANSPSIAARLSNIPPAALQPMTSSGRMQNVPAAALVPPGANGGGDGTTPPRNSILERLRAQRNSILPPRPPTR